MKNIKIKKPKFDITLILFYLIFCANLLWAIFDKGAVYDKLINPDKVKYELLFMFEFFLFMNLVQIYFLEQGEKIKKEFRIIYYIGLVLILISYVVSFYYKTLFLLIPGILGILLSFFTVVKMLLEKHSKPIKIIVTEYYNKVSFNSKFNYAKYMLGTFVFILVGLGILNEFFVTMLSSNLCIGIMGIALILLEIKKTSIITNDIESNKKRRMIYNLITVSMAIGIAFYINNVIFPSMVMILKVIFFAVVFSSSIIFSDVEINNRYIIKLFENKEEEINL